MVGDVIGPGNLTKEKMKELSISVIQFLKMYNAMLRDYTGSEVFSIEFELYNIEKGTQIKVFPKSMIFIPGNYKDCESLLVALKPETGYLNTHISRKELNKINKLFYEVEEFTNRPDLNKDEKEVIYRKFASRFNKKLFGELFEDKWNKKLIGLSESLPTEKEMLNINASIKSKIETLWQKRPFEIKIIDSKYEILKSPYSGQSAIDHLKFSISEPSANFIIQNTLKLGNNLINLANSGTIDETQDDIISFLIYKIEQKIKTINVPKTVDWLINEVNKILGELENYLNKFIDYSKNFLNTGEAGDLMIILEKYKLYIIDKGRLENEDFEKICNIAINSIKKTIIEKEISRVIELNSVIYYFSELVKLSINLIKFSLPKYLMRRRLKTLIIEYIKRIKNIFEAEQKPSKNLGLKFIEKFNAHLHNQIEINPVLLTSNLKFNEKNLISEFKNLIKNNIDLYFDNIELNMGDLISFAEVLMETASSSISGHIEKFKKFSNEINFLLGYVLRYTTINRYIKEESEDDISDPIAFANKFQRFLEKRIGGINLEWKSYILNWIQDYNKKFLSMKEDKEWTLDEIYNDFISYLEEREQNEQKTENFLKFLDSYIAQVNIEAEKISLLDLLKQYEFCNKIKLEFPLYIKKILEKELNIFIPQFEQQIPINFLSLEEETFYNYLKEVELKYYSKLIPRPLTLILHHNLTKEERDLFKSDLFHVINFRYWGDNLKADMSDNFKQVYREWHKEL
jgi:hypothetical protein